MTPYSPQSALIPKEKGSGLDKEKDGGTQQRERGGTGDKRLTKGPPVFADGSMGNAPP